MPTTKEPDLLVAFRALEDPEEDPHVAAALLAHQLFRLGGAARDDRKSARDLLAKLSTTERAGLFRALADARAAETRRLAASLSDASGRSDLLAAPAVLTDDPLEAERLQRRALTALASREAIFRFDSVAEAFDLEGESQQKALLAELDALLKSALAGWSGLRTKAAALAEDFQLGRWPSVDGDRFWLSWTLDAREDARDVAFDPDDETEEQIEPLLDWIKSRSRDGDDGVCLTLSRDESRALLSTERGRNLAHYLGDSLDVSAALPTEAELAHELTGGQGARSPVPWARLATRWLAGNLFPEGLKSALHKLIPHADVTLAAVGHAADGDPIRRGAGALTNYEARVSGLDLELGLVSIGYLLGGGADGACTGEEVLLVIPRRSVCAVRLDDAASRVRREQWVGGGILWPLPTTGGSEVNLRFVDSDNESEQSCRFPIRAAPDEPDIFSLLLRLATFGTLNQAREALDLVRSELRAPEAEALEGLVDALQSTPRADR